MWITEALEIEESCNMECAVGLSIKVDFFDGLAQTIFQLVTLLTNSTCHWQLSF